MFSSKNIIQKNVDYITKSHLRNVMQLAIFQTGNDEIYAINISKILTFLIKDNVDITRTPSSDKIVHGVINLRGEFITVVDLDSWIGVEIDDSSIYKIIIVCNYNERKIGILVKDIIKIEEKNSDELKLPSGDDPKISYVTDVEIDGNSRTCIIFDAERLLSDVNVAEEKGSTIYDINKMDDFPTINSKKVLLVAEDSKIVTEKLEQFFNAIGIRYEIFSDGKALLERLKEYHIYELGLVVTDIEMPIKNGYQVIKHLKSDPVYKYIPVVALTSMTNRGVNDKVLKLGALDLINKADIKKLYGYIKKYLEME